MFQYLNKVSVGHRELPQRRGGWRERKKKREEEGKIFWPIRTRIKASYTLVANQSTNKGQLQPVPAVADPAGLDQPITYFIRRHLGKSPRSKPPVPRGPHL